VKVLLVEDSLGDARLFAELLRELPAPRMELTTVGTLSDAIDVAANHDVVFLDLSLPDAHGMATVTRMIAAVRLLPIVVLTGNDDDRVASGGPPATRSSAKRPRRMRACSRSPTRPGAVHGLSRA
jgi:CheY-like chemotaxis protein